jgi:hypothetical protein
MALPAAFPMLFTLMSFSVCFQQDVIVWTSNAPLLIARRSILTIAECSQNLHAGYSHKKHTTASIVCPVPRKHTRFKSSPILPASDGGPRCSILTTLSNTISRVPVPLGFVDLLGWSAGRNGEDGGFLLYNVSQLQ